MVNRFNHLQDTLFSKIHLLQDNNQCRLIKQSTAITGVTLVSVYVCPHSYIQHMWLDLPRLATYAHNGKEHFSSPIDSSINKLTNYHNITAKSWLVYFLWDLFLRPVRPPQVFKCSLNATSWLVQAVTLLKITTWLVHDVGHGLFCILWHFECNGISF